MKPICSACEDRPVFVLSDKKLRLASTRGVRTHDLRGRSYRSLRNQMLAARKFPKPLWAVRSTLKLMEEQVAKE